MQGLMNDTGATTVTRDFLESLETPQGTHTHRPVAHSEVLGLVERAMSRYNMHVTDQQLLLDKENARFFALLGVANDAKDRQTLIGVRNSHDKSISAGIVVGDQVFVCSNLCFSGEVSAFRKHTVHAFNPDVHNNLANKIEDAVAKAVNVTHMQDRRVELYKRTQLDSPPIFDVSAVDSREYGFDASSLVDSLLMGLYRNGVVPSSKMGQVWDEWVNPSHPEFCEDGMSLWRLQQSITEVLKPKTVGQLNTTVARTQTMIRMFDVVAKAISGEAVQGEVVYA